MDEAEPRESDDDDDDDDDEGSASSGSEQVDDDYDQSNEAAEADNDDNDDEDDVTCTSISLRNPFELLADDSWIPRFVIFHQVVRKLCSVKDDMQWFFRC